MESESNDSQETMKSMETVFYYLQPNSSTEERLAGILMAQKVLGKLNEVGERSRNDVFDFHHRIIMSASPAFIIRMVKTFPKTLNGTKNELELQQVESQKEKVKAMTQKAGLWLLECACLDHSTASLFVPFIEELIEVLVEFDAELYRINSLKKSRGEAGKDGKEGSAGDDVDEGTAEEDPSKDARFGIDIVLLLIKVCLHNDTSYVMIERLIHCLLNTYVTRSNSSLVHGEKKSQNRTLGNIVTTIPSLLLGMISDAAISQRDKSSVSESGVGGIKTTNRITLSPEMSLIVRSLIVQSLHGGAPELIRDSALASLQDLLSPSSLVNPHWTLEGNKEGDLRDIATDKGQENQKEGSFASFVTSILRVEFHLLLEEAQCLFGSAEPGDEDIGKETEKKEEKKGKGKGKGKSVSQEHNTLQKRMDRLFRMVDTCCSLLDIFLMLLVGTSVSQEQDTSIHSVEQESSSALWGEALSSTALLDLRQSIHSIVQQMLDFVKFASSTKYLDGRQDIASSTSHQPPEPIDMACQQQRQHQDPTALPSIVHRVVNTLTRWVYEDEALYHTFITHVPYLLECSILLKSRKRSDGNTTFKEREASNSADNEMNKYEILTAVFPCLLSIAVNSLDRGSEGNEGKNDYGASDETEGPICIRLCDMTCLVYALCLILSEILKVRGGDAIEIEPIVGKSSEFFDILGVSAADLLSVLLSFKAPDIAILTKGEGLVDAVNSAFSFSLQNSAFSVKGEMIGNIGAMMSSLYASMLSSCYSSLHKSNELQHPFDASIMSLLDIMIEECKFPT